MRRSKNQGIDGTLLMWGGPGREGAVCVLGGGGEYHPPGLQPGLPASIQTVHPALSMLDHRKSTLARGSRWPCNC